MLEKTRERIERRFKSLPVHHIDSSVFLELFSRSNEARICETYLNKTLFNYRGKICIPAMGEIASHLTRNLSDNKDVLIETFLAINRLIDRKQIDIYSFRKIPSELMRTIEENDSRIKPLDAINYACSVEDKAYAFVTLDRELMESQKLQSIFGVKIRHPEEFI